MSKKSVLEYLVPSTDISVSAPKVVLKNDHRIVLVDDDGDRIIYEGSGLAFKNGMVTKGEIDSLLLETKNHKPLLSFTNIDLDIPTLASAPMEGLTQYAFMYGLRHHNLMLGSKVSDEFDGGIGNDVIKGRGGGDFLAGGAGNDVLVGGGGEDIFDFDAGDGKDRILDFDADATDGKQDIINADDSDVIGFKNVKGNLVLNFGHGDTLTLVGVKDSDIDGSDFAI